MNDNLPPDGQPASVQLTRPGASIPRIAPVNPADVVAPPPAGPPPADPPPFGLEHTDASSAPSTTGAVRAPATPRTAAEPSAARAAATKRQPKQQLFRQADVITARSAGTTIWVTAGEVAAGQLAAAGLCATCNVASPGRWKPPQLEVLATAKRVVIVPGPAGTAAAELLAEALRNRVEQVVVLNQLGAADVAAWLGKGKTEDQVLELDKTRAGGSGEPPEREPGGDDGDEPPDEGPMKWKSNNYDTLCRLLERPKFNRFLLGGRQLTFDEMSLRPCLGGRPVTKKDVGGIRRLILRKHYDAGLDPLTFYPPDIYDAIELVAGQRTVHPVREFLKSLVWNKKLLIHLVPAAVLGAEPTPLNSTLVRKWMISAVARAMRPGCKVDTTLILQGVQGGKKSGFFECLAYRDVPGREGWYCGSEIVIGLNDTFLKIHGPWIYEIQELHGLMSARSAQQVKGFLTEPIDRFRLPYARDMEDFPRSNVFCGTTNDEGFLTDPTGNRRFWPIECGIAKVKTEWLKANRDQLWAEAFAAYEADEQWWLTDEEEKALEPIHRAHMPDDDWIDFIVPWLEANDAKLAEKPPTSAQILVDALGVPPERCDKRAKDRIAAIMGKNGLGWVKSIPERRTVEVDGKKVSQKKDRFWRKP